MEQEKLEKAKELLAEVREGQQQITDSLASILTDGTVVDIANKMLEIHKIVGDDYYIKERVPVLMWYMSMHMYAQKMLDGLQTPLGIKVDKDYEALERITLQTLEKPLEQFHSDLQAKIIKLSNENLKNKMQKELGIPLFDMLGATPQELLKVADILFGSDDSDK